MNIIVFISDSTSSENSTSDIPASQYLGRVLNEAGICHDRIAHTFDTVNIEFVKCLAQATSAWQNATADAGANNCHLVVWSERVTFEEQWSLLQITNRIVLVDRTTCSIVLGECLSLKTGSR